MRDVLEVAPDLVAAAGQRLDVDERIAAGGMAAVAERPLEAAHAAEVRDGRHPWLAGGRQFRIACQRVIDLAGFRRPTAHQREVLLAHATGFEHLAPLARRLRRACEHQHAAGGFVETVQGPEPLAELLLEQEQGVAVLVRVECAGMHEQAGRLVDGGELGIEVQQGQRRVHRRGQLRVAVNLRGPAAVRTVPLMRPLWSAVPSNCIGPAENLIAGPRSSAAVSSVRLPPTVAVPCSTW